MTVLEYTNKGCRESNQDYMKSCFLSEGIAIYVVTDGMGGYSYGDLAAKIVAEAIINYVSDHVSKMTPGQLLSAAFSFANESLSLTRMGLDTQEMGCVAVALLIKGDMAYWAWLGDSRIYIFRDNQEIYHTEDHSMVTELSKIRSLSLDDIDRYSAFVTKAIMGDDEEVAPSIMKLQIQKGDVFVLCSDGLYRQWQVSNIASSDGVKLITRLKKSALLMDDNYSFIRVSV